MSPAWKEQTHARTANPRFRSRMQCTLLSVRRDVGRVCKVSETAELRRVYFGWVPTCAKWLYSVLNTFSGVTRARGCGSVVGRVFNMHEAPVSIPCASGFSLHCFTLFPAHKESEILTMVCYRSLLPGLSNTNRGCGSKRRRRNEKTDCALTGPRFRNRGKHVTARTFGSILQYY